MVLPRSARLGSPHVESTPGGDAFRQGTVLLLFKRGATVAGVDMPDGHIPPHDGDGPLLLAFAVTTEALERWEKHLAINDIESRVAWERGGRSIYFRDPAGHSVELATPRTWAVY